MIIAVAIMALFRSLGFGAILIVVPMMLLLAATGVAALTIEVGDAFAHATRKEAMMRAGASLSIVATTALLLPLWINLAARAMIWTALLVNHAAYSRIVDEARRDIIKRDGSSIYQSAYGVRYILDAGPPLRVAFSDGGGPLDQWGGFVYDPSGRVAQARGFTDQGTLTAPARVRTLFGGDMVSCSHLTGSYYYCIFT